MKVLAGLWRWPDAKAAIASPFPEGSRWRLETGPPRPGDPRFGPIAASETMKCLRVFSRPDQPPPIPPSVGGLARFARGRQFSVVSGQSPLPPVGSLRSRSSVLSCQWSVPSPAGGRGLGRGWKRAFGGGNRPPSPSLGSGTPPVPTSFAQSAGDGARGCELRLAHSCPRHARLFGSRHRHPVH